MMSSQLSIVPMAGVADGLSTEAPTPSAVDAPGDAFHQLLALLSVQATQPHPPVQSVPMAEAEDVPSGAPVDGAADDIAETVPHHDMEAALINLPTLIFGGDAQLTALPHVAPTEAPGAVTTAAVGKDALALVAASLLSMTAESMPAPPLSLDSQTIGSSMGVLQGSIPSDLPPVEAPVSALAATVQTQPPSVSGPPAHELPPAFTTQALVRAEEGHLRTTATQVLGQSHAGPDVRAAVMEHASATPTDVDPAAVASPVSTGELMAEELAQPEPPRPQGQDKAKAARELEGAVLSAEPQPARGDGTVQRVTASAPGRDLPDEPHRGQQPPSVRVDIQPPELGRVRLHVTLADRTVYANVMTERPELQDFLTRQHARLESVLQGQGLQIGGFHVGLHDHGRGRSDLGWAMPNQATDRPDRGPSEVGVPPASGGELQRVGQWTVNVFV